MTILSMPLYAQKEVVREGNQFSVSSSKSHTKDEGTKTAFTWKDSKGGIYEVYQSKKGAFFINRISKKTGKPYRQYLPKEVQEQMRNSL